MAAGAGFLVKSCIGFCVCCALSKVVSSSHKRFLVWFGFLVGAGCYWLWLVACLVRNGVSPGAVGRSESLAPIVDAWQIQNSWAFIISILLRGLVGLYLLGLIYFLFARIKKVVHLRWILRFAYSAPETIESIFQPIAERMGAGHVPLRMLSGIHSPATFGWIRPMVLLPQFCLEQDPGQLADVFRHELQHVRRRDYVLNTVASICRALLFFHPASWYALRKLELESELACDQAVISDSPESRASYAECLVRFARLNVTQEPSPWNLDFVGSSVQLKVRIRSLLAETGNVPNWLLGLRSVLALLLIAGFLAIAPSLSIALSYTRQSLAPAPKPAGIVTHTAIRLHSPARHGRVHADSAQMARAFEVSAPPVRIAEPIETPTGATPIQPPQERETIPSSDPALKLRTVVSGTSIPKSSGATVIQLSSAPTRARSRFITKGRAFASALTTAAGEAARVASRGRDRDDH